MKSGIVDLFYRDAFGRIARTVNVLALAHGYSNGYLSKKKHKSLTRRQGLVLTN
jgi:hypothetical protein